MKRSEHASRIDTPAAILWGSAFLLMALIIMRLGDSMGTPAFADMVANNDDGMSIVTTDDGNGDEFVGVIDGSRQQFYVYSVSARNGFELVSRVDLAESFEGGRRSAAGN